MSYDISTTPLWATGVSHKLQQVGFFLSEDQLATILNKVATPAMPLLERGRITGQQPPHDR